LNPFLDNRPGNGAPNGLEEILRDNAGPNISRERPSQIQSGVPIFNPAGTSCLTETVADKFSTYSPSAKLPHSLQHNYKPEYEKSFGGSMPCRSVMWAALRIACDYGGYQSASPGDICRRRGTAGRSSIFAQFPDFGVINEIETNGNSTTKLAANSPEVRDWHRLHRPVHHTWAHGLDDMTAYRGTLPQAASI